jgi:hypothetical protein
MVLGPIFPGGFDAQPVLEMKPLRKVDFEDGRKFRKVRRGI